MKNIICLGLAFAAAFNSTVLQAQDKVKYIDTANMGRAVKPGDNFYLYANGNWVKKNTIPASKTRWGTFDVLREESSQRLRGLLEDAGSDTTNNQATHIIGEFYSSGMDSIAAEVKGYQPLLPLLTEINALPDIPAVVREMATLRTHGAGSPLFGFSISPDKKNVLKYVPYISFGGTTMPDKEYYLKDDARSVKIRNAYKQYLNTLFMLTGDDPAAAAINAAAVLRIETALATAQYSRTEMRDPYKTYNKITVKDLSVTSQHFNWQELMPLMKIAGADTVVINNPGLYKTADSLLSAQPLEDWKSYLRWNVMKIAAPFLSNAFVSADFAYTQAQNGQKQPIPRWQRMSSLIDGRLGDLIGQLYVNKYFKPAAKQRMAELVENAQETFAERIKKLDWMSAGTKRKALEKLNAVARKIAYPDKWKTYDGLLISTNDFPGNITNANVWAYNYNINKMGKPVDRTEMGMTPPTINASYSTTNNDITFPAGILQYPFFDFGADDAVNYGGIGAVIGHELTHGFDDQGRQYDAAGNLQDWWAPADGQKFKAKANEVVYQFNALTVLDTVHVNGRLTLGENLADLGGVSIAYEAFTKTQQFKENKTIDGFTPSQRFFINFAQLWRNNSTPESAAQLIVTDPHAPGVHRVNATLQNIDAWYKAFNIQPGDKLYKAPEKRTKIW